jgi:hypothetical protein
MDAKLTTMHCKEKYCCEIQRLENRMETQQNLLSKVMAPEGLFAYKDDYRYDKETFVLLA